MRIALITLLVAALAFITSITWMLAKKDTVKNQFSTHQNPSLLEPRTKNTDSNADAVITLETLKYQAKTEQKLENLEKKLDAIIESRGVHQEETPGASPKEPQKAPQITEQIDAKIVPISAKFLSKIMPTITLKKLDNKGIFWLKIFDKDITYTSYEDSKFGITVIASMLPYNEFLKNFKALDDKVFTVNETKSFPFRSFYVNPPKSDSTARLVMQVETQTLLITIPKSRFATFKKLILSK